MAVTPKAIAGFSKFLYEKDTEGKFAKQAYTFEVRLPKGDEKVEAFVKMLMKAHKDAGDGQYPPVKDGDKLKTKSEKRAAYAKGHYLVDFKSSTPPTLVDSQKRPLGKTKIMGGDVVKVAFGMKPYDAFGGGISRYLNAVMLIEKNAGGFGADEFDTEDGFTESEASANDEVPFDSDDSPDY